MITPGHFDHRRWGDFILIKESHGSIEFCFTKMEFLILGPHLPLKLLKSLTVLFAAFMRFKLFFAFEILPTDHALELFLIRFRFTAELVPWLTGLSPLRHYVIL